MAAPPKVEKNGSMRIDPNLVRELARLLTDNELTEIEVQDGERRIKVSREPAAVIGASVAAAPQQMVAPALSGPPMHAKEDVGAEAEEVGGHTVKSPMVGTAYLAPQPEAPPFVKLGDSVREGQTLLIIEAMKVMNQIRAPRAGRISRVYIGDAEPVEYGTALMLIE